jgi:hypothetical protein
MKQQVCDVVRAVRYLLASMAVEVDWIEWGERTLELHAPDAVHDLATRVMMEPNLFGENGEPKRRVSLRDAEVELADFFSKITEFEFPVGVGAILVCGNDSFGMDVVYLIWRACQKAP